MPQKEQNHMPNIINSLCTDPALFDKNVRQKKKISTVIAILLKKWPALFLMYSMQFNWQMAIHFQQIAWHTSCTELKPCNT